MASPMLQKAAHAADRFGRNVGRRRDSRVVRGLVRVARSVVTEYDETTLSYNMDRNGEAWLLGRIGPVANTVFDVGANVGEWTECALRNGVDRVHAFEIMPQTAAQFRRRIGVDRRVSLNTVGLGATAGSTEVLYYPENSALTSTATRYPHDLPHERAVAKVTTGDAYVEEHGIERIDLVKVDVEGEEPNVLRGFQQCLDAGRIGAVQFEYGVVAALQRFLIIDFYELLGAQGFEIGPLLRDRVRFQEYNLNLERFQFVNWVAVHRDRPDLRQRVAG